VGYIERNLVPGETLVYKTGWHWIVMFWSSMAGLLVAVGGAALIVLANLEAGAEYHREILIAGVAALIFAAIVVIAGAVHRAATEVAVSSQRVLIKTGLLSRRSIEVLLPKVESIGINENFMGRLLGYGTVVIRGTGGTYETFDNIRQPNELRRQVQAQLGKPRSS
jgi:uncharacterized membrane protein YdbT with pleckstrin-like domain